MSDNIFQRNIIPIRASLLESCKQFIAENNLDAAKYIYSVYTGDEPKNTSTVIPFYFTAQAGKPGEPDGYVLKFIYDKEITLPPGRYISLDHKAGHIDYMSCLLPLQTMPFEQVIQTCWQIAKSFENCGFVIKRLNKTLSQKRFGEKNFGSWDTFGSWHTQTDKPLIMTMTLENFNKRPTAAFNMPISNPEPLDAPATYIISFSITTDFSFTEELIRLERARNLAINGDEKKPIPIKIWFDDPDWRPEGWQGKWL